MDGKKIIYVGDVLKRLRKEKGLTQERLAEISELATRFIGYLETDERQPTVTTLFYLAKGFEMEPWELMKEIQEAIDWK